VALEGREKELVSCPKTMSTRGGVIGEYMWLDKKNYFEETLYWEYYDLVV
jgi:hypothetical protein